MGKVRGILQLGRLLYGEEALTLFTFSSNGSFIDDATNTQRVYSFHRKY